MFVEKESRVVYLLFLRTENVVNLGEVIFRNVNFYLRLYNVFRRGDIEK